MPATTSARPSRDWLIDVVRAASIIVVIAMHWTWMQVTWVDRRIVLHNSLSGSVMRSLTWLLMVMPLFFLAGGMANTLVVDRCRRRGESYGQFLAVRARRLLAPLIPLTAVFAVVGLIAPHISAQVAATVAREPGNVLWFLAIYLLCTALAPFQVRMHDHLGWWAGPVLWLALAGVGDVLRFSHRIDGTYVMLAVWPACHALGVLYRRRTLWRAPTWALLLGAVAVAAWTATTVKLGWYAPQNIGLADDPRQNLMPPTSVLVWIGVVQLLLLTPLARRLEGWSPRPRAQRGIQSVNGLLMHLYLWHVPVLVAATGVGMLAPALLMPTDPARWWAERLVWIPLQGAALTGIVLLATRWDLAVQRFAVRTRLLPALACTAVGFCAVAALWKNGLSARPDSLMPAVAVALAVAGLTRLRQSGPTAGEPPAASAEKSLAGAASGASG